MATPFQCTDLCKQVELQAMAEDLATLGYMPDPKFSWQMPCKYVALDVNVQTDTRAGDHPVIHSTIDFRSQIKAAWPVLLDQLQQSGIAIPDIARQPILPGINDTCRNRVRPDGLEVNCWVVELGSFDWIDFYGNYRGKQAIPSMKLGNVYNQTILAVQYHYDYRVYSAASTSDDMAISRGHNTNEIFISNKSVSSAAALKQSLQGQYLIYPLAEPIFIPFENPVNLSLGELSKYTFIGAHDINDAPMYDLQTHYPYGDAPENADGHHHFLLTRWNAAWLRQHHEFPMTAITTFDGIGFVANYDSAFTDHFLLQDVVKQLKDKGIIQ